MSVRKADDFIADVERQFDWYLTKAAWEVADRYLDAVEATCQLLAQHPNLGPRGGFTHPRLPTTSRCCVHSAFRLLPTSMRLPAVVQRYCRGSDTEPLPCTSYAVPRLAPTRRRRFPNAPCAI
jgi:plasmid stabilization system protein ParE